jgi:TonB-linked SusC/RagA family outer membrane protein
MYKIYTIKPDRPSGRVQLILRAMRLVTILLITTMMQVSAASVAQNISMHKQNAELKEVFKSIRAQSGYDFIFDMKLMEKAKLVTISLNNASLEETLKRCFANQDFTYAIADKTVIVREKTFMDDVRNYFADIEVIGTVLDENGQPMPGVGVKVKGTNKTTVTGLSGRYYIRTDENNPILIFSYVGYKTKELTAKANLDVTMALDPAKLDEVLVIGYGTTTRRLSTGSQVGISAKDIEKQPVTNLLQTLQGRMPGVQVTQTNGLPGAGINVQIRGANSIGKSNRPLYIIDGVPFLSEPINTASSSTSVLPSAEGSTSPLNSINPSDIESIEVLKDADATAIYGSRAANGVVLITTKKGTAGKTRFNVNASSGASVVAHFVDLLNTEEYLALRRKGFANLTTSPTAPSVTSAPDLLVWDQNASTNWQKELLGGTARTHDVTTNVSGGDANTNFYISGTYHQEGNIYPGEQGYKRGGANVSLNHSSPDKKFTLGFSAIYSTDKNNISSTELSNYAYSLPPNFPVYKADGTLNWVGGSNPYGYLLQTNDNRSSNLLGSLNLKYNILEGLDIKSTFGYSKTDMNQVTLRPLGSLSTAFSVPVSGTAAYAYTYSNNYIVEPQITYNRKVWKGSLNVLAGGTYQFKQSKQPYYTSAQGFSSDDFLRNVSLATTVSTSSSSRDYKYASVFGRVNYNIEDKYIVNLNFRRDGSSRFGPNKKFGNFGSAGAAWIFSEEDFIKDKTTWFSFGKLRGSYGVIGSDEIGDYQYLETFSSKTAIYNGTSSLVPTRIANDDFQWETTKKLDLGLELGFFNDRLSVSASYYRNRSSNQLINYPLSAQTGFTSYQSNLPATVQNSGLELGVNTTNIKVKDFSWTSAFNISKNANKLLSFPNIEKTSYYTTYLVGKPISSFYAYQFTGIDPATNLPAFTDFNGVGGTASPTTGLEAIGRGDRYFVGSAYPSFFGGLTNTVTYKGFTLDFTLQFVKQKGRSLAAASFYPPGYMYNAAASVVNEYLALGSQDYLVTAGTAGTNGRPAYFGYSSWTGSDANIVDASFIRMKNVNLSYTLPSKWISKVHAQQIRVFTQAQNLFTITKYKGFDPESQGIVTPPLRTIVAGLQFTF